MHCFRCFSSCWAPYLLYMFYGLNIKIVVYLLCSQSLVICARTEVQWEYQKRLKAGGISIRLDEPSCPLTNGWFELYCCSGFFLYFNQQKYPVWHTKDQLHYWAYSWRLLLVNKILNGVMQRRRWTIKLIYWYPNHSQAFPPVQTVPTQSQGRS